MLVLKFAICCSERHFPNVINYCSFKLIKKTWRIDRCSLLSTREIHFVQVSQDSNIQNNDSKKQAPTLVLEMCMWGGCHNRASSSNWRGQGDSARLCLLSSLTAEGGEAGPAPVCFEYRGSISPTRGQDLKAGAEVMSWVPRDMTCFLHRPLVIEPLEGWALLPTEFGPQGDQPQPP